jgi:hypothetical protein
MRFERLETSGLWKCYEYTRDFEPDDYDLAEMSAVLNWCDSTGLESEWDLTHTFTTGSEGYAEEGSPVQIKLRQWRKEFDAFSFKVWLSPELERLFVARYCGIELADVS